MPIRVLPWLATLLLLVPAAAQQTPDLTGEVTAEGIRRIRIALPEAEAGPGAAEFARQIVETIRGDLDFSGWFDVIDPGLYHLVPAGNPGTIRYDDWISIGADHLTDVRVTVRDGRLDVVVRLYDNTSKTLLFGQRYGGTRELGLRLAHQISSDVMKRMVGRDGVALTRIAFVSKHGEGKEIYLVDYDGRRVRRLTTTGTINLSPVWSPDGQRLAFVSWRAKQPSIYVMDADGTLGTLPAVTAELNAAPDWSPDGKRIVYTSDAAGNSEIYLMDIAAGRNTRLTRTGAIETAPDFSPNGREIAFVSDRSGTPQIYVMDTEGLNVRRVSHRGSYNESPAWSPRGDRLAYVSRIDGRFDVVVLDLATGEIRRLTHGEGNNENPRWSPDGRHLVFSSNRAGTYDIYTMRDDGSDVRRLTRNGNCFTADWSP